MAKQSLAKKSNKTRTDTERRQSLAQRALWYALELCGCLLVAWVVVVTVLGWAAAAFAGDDFWSNLVPFAVAVLGLSWLLYGGLHGWQAVRRALALKLRYGPVLLALSLAAAALVYAHSSGFYASLGWLRSLVGGARHAERATLAHQVYAAYRRADMVQMQALMLRAKPYQRLVEAAARTFAVDARVLMGIAAAESSFLPRDSKDGGRGLFQITLPPDSVLASVSRRLEANQPLDWRNPKHNALLAAATWRHYQREMNGDVFLGLLAYNIGPKNGGLLSIMRQYGAHDFVTVQPYLQNLPRDYPIRVLTAALAFKLWATEGRLLRYEEGDNARRIQSVGIPGLS